MMLKYHLQLLTEIFIMILKKLNHLEIVILHPFFLFKDLKVIKYMIHKKKYISCILKSTSGFSINSISLTLKTVI